MAPVWKKLQQGQALADEERTTVAGFMSLIMTRVPNYRANIERMHAAMTKHFGRMIMNRDGFFEQVRRDLEAQGKTLPKNIDELEQKMRAGGFEVEVKPESSLDVVTDEFGSVFSQMGWALVTAHHNYPFVTSDNPLVYFDPTHDPRSPYGVGLLNRNIEVTLPVSRTLALIAGWRAYVPFFKATERLTRVINHRTIEGAQRFVYASEASDGLSKLVRRLRDTAPRLRIN